MLSLDTRVQGAHIHNAVAGVNGPIRIDTGVTGASAVRYNKYMNVRTPDPYPGWLSEEDLYEARRRLPMVYVEALPVRLDALGYVSDAGAVYLGDGGGPDIAPATIPPGMVLVLGDHRGASADGRTSVPQRTRHDASQRR